MEIVFTQIMLKILGANSWRAGARDLCMPVLLSFNFVVNEILILHYGNFAVKQYSLSSAEHNL
jgi:hypothetical protein